MNWVTKGSRSEVSKGGCSCLPALDHRRPWNHWTMRKSNINLPPQLSDTSKRGVVEKAAWKSWEQLYYFHARLHIACFHVSQEVVLKLRLPLGATIRTIRSLRFNATSHSETYLLAAPLARFFRTALISLVKGKDCIGTLRRRRIRAILLGMTQDSYHIEKIDVLKPGEHFEELMQWICWNVKWCTLSAVFAIYQPKKRHQRQTSW